MKAKNRAAEDVRDVTVNSEQEFKFLIFTFT